MKYISFAQKNLLNAYDQKLTRWEELPESQEKSRFAFHFLVYVNKNCHLQLRICSDIIQGKWKMCRVTEHSNTVYVNFKVLFEFDMIKLQIFFCPVSEGSVHYGGKGRFLCLMLMHLMKSFLIKSKISWKSATIYGRS